jgi:hypothetical protein
MWQAIDLDRQRLGLQPVAVAGRAGGVGHVALDFLARPGAVGFLPAALEIGMTPSNGLRSSCRSADRHHRRRRSSPVVPNRMASATSSSRSFQLVVSACADMLAERFQRLGVIGRTADFAQGAMAPSRRTALCSGTIRRPRIVFWVPRPSQVGQAPNGLLKENSRGSISDGEAGDRAGELLRESIRSWVSLSDLLAEPPAEVSASAAACRQIRRPPARRQFQAGLEGCRQAGRRCHRAPRCGPRPRRCRACTSCRAAARRRSRSTRRRP